MDRYYHYLLKLVFHCSFNLIAEKCVITLLRLEWIDGWRMKISDMVVSYLHLIRSTTSICRCQSSRILPSDKFDHSGLFIG